MELVGPRWRLLLGMIYNVSYAIGYMMISAIAFIFKDGINFDLFCVSPTFLFFAFYL